MLKVKFISYRERVPGCGYGEIKTESDSGEIIIYVGARIKSGMVEGVYKMDKNGTRIPLAVFPLGEAKFTDEMMDCVRQFISSQTGEA